MDGMGIGTMASAYGFIRDILSDCRRWATSGDPRLGRWRQLVQAHGHDPLTALLYLGVVNAPVSITRDDTVLASRLDASLLQQTADRFGVRLDWLLGFDDRIYDLMYLEPSLESLVCDLREWKSVGHDHRILAFRSDSWELKDSISQSGVLILERSIGSIGERSTPMYRPVYTMQWWGDDELRWLAMRAIWAAWYMGFDVRGYRAARKECHGFAEGTVLPGPSIARQGRGCWYPEDYVVRPSARATGNDALIEEIEREHAEELQTMAAADKWELRQWGKFR